MMKTPPSREQTKGLAMGEGKDTVTVHVNLEISPGALQAVVENAKVIAGRNEKGHYQVDTADLLGATISRFLMEKGFESYAADINNCR
jgi:hypothetical protein